MKNQFLLFFSLLLLVMVMVSCNESKEEVSNPFATPEGCVKEYYDARDSCDAVRMLKCYSYNVKYERLLAEKIEKELEEISKEKKTFPEYYWKTDSVILKNNYPNSAVVTVFYTRGYYNNQRSSHKFDLNLVKDSTNWKIETQLRFSIN